MPSLTRPVPLAWAGGAVAAPMAKFPAYRVLLATLVCGMVPLKGVVTEMATCTQARPWEEEEDRAPMAMAPISTLDMEVVGDATTVVETNTVPHHRTVTILSRVSSVGSTPTSANSSSGMGLGPADMAFRASNSSTR